MHKLMIAKLYGGRVVSLGHQLLKDWTEIADIDSLITVDGLHWTKS
jgi:hypothetical protein